jgi:hypothetical protein
MSEQRRQISQTPISYFPWWLRAWHLSKVMKCRDHIRALDALNCFWFQNLVFRQDCNLNIASQSRIGEFHGNTSSEISLNSKSRRIFHSHLVFLILNSFVFIFILLLLTRVCMWL